MLPDGEDLNEWLAVHGGLTTGSGDVLHPTDFLSRGLFQPSEYALRYHHGVLHAAGGTD